MICGSGRRFRWRLLRERTGWRREILGRVLGNQMWRLGMLGYVDREKCGGSWNASGLECLARMLWMRKPG